MADQPENEAAERLRRYLSPSHLANGILDAALATERRLTVERIRERLARIDLSRILDEEANR